MVEQCHCILLLWIINVHWSNTHLFISRRDMWLAHISRHVQSRAHSWSKEESRYAAARLGLKKAQAKTSTYKNYRVEGCTARVTKLSQHMRKVHNKNNKANITDKCGCVLLQRLAGISRFWWCHETNDPATHGSYDKIVEVQRNQHIFKFPIWAQSRQLHCDRIKIQSLYTFRVILWRGLWLL